MAKISICLKWVAGVAFWLMTSGVGAAADNGLRFGVFPSVSARILVETYQPLAVAIGDSIGQQVGLESAPDFITFHQRTLNGEYDLVLTAPHLAWLAWKEGGYRPLLSYVTPVQGIMIVRSDSPYRRISDLRGKTIAMPDALAIVGIRMEKILEKAGLRRDRDFKAIEAGSHTNAATYIKEGKADAAVVGIQAFQQLPKELKDSMRGIIETPAMPGQIFLVHGGMSHAKELAIGQAIEHFTRSEGGKVFLQRGKFGGVRPLKKNELKQMEGDAKALKQRLQTYSSGNVQ
jgi:phosphonate transport system substrate-binding protein